MIDAFIKVMNETCFFFLFSFILKIRCKTFQFWEMMFTALCSAPNRIERDNIWNRVKANKR